MTGTPSSELCTYKGMTLSCPLHMVLETLHEPVYSHSPSLLVWYVMHTESDGPVITGIGYKLYYKSGKI